MQIVLFEQLTDPTQLEAVRQLLILRGKEFIPSTTAACRNKKDRL